MAVNKIIYASSFLRAYKRDGDRRRETWYVTIPKAIRTLLQEKGVQPPTPVVLEYDPDKLTIVVRIARLVPVEVEEQ